MIKAGFAAIIPSPDNGYHSQINVDTYRGWPVRHRQATPTEIANVYTNTPMVIISSTANGSRTVHDHDHLSINRAIMHVL